jgi:hypothetical protein
MKSNKKELSMEQRKELLNTLKARFEKNMSRHKAIKWDDVQARLEANAEKLWSLDDMEITGGEPDVVGYDKKKGEYIFYDCSAESPKGRRVFVTMAMRWSQGKKINRKIMRWIWQLKWALNYYRKNSTGNCRN